VVIIFGYMIVFASLYALYHGDVFFGAVAFIVGGVLAKKLFFCLRSTGVITMVISISYGYHNGYNAFMFFAICIGFLMACFNGGETLQSSKDGAWGINLDLFGSDSGSDGGGD